MKNLTSRQTETIKMLSNKYGFEIHLIEPGAIGATIDKMTLPIDYLTHDLKGTGIKMTTNLPDRCLCLFV